MKHLLVLAGFLLASACAPDAPQQEGEGEGGAAWLSGTVDERFQQVGDQLGGFSQSMLEVGQRYAELHWAVEDGNWEHAGYQTEKIGDAVERGIIRRPGRGASASEMFLTGPLPDFEEALATRDPERIRQGLNDLTTACNQCHVAEDMAFIQVGPPPARTSAVQPREDHR